MPRPKCFDVEETLERAMRLFWARGYEGTSMRDLVAATGVNRASLYATYGDKHALFLAALGHYDRRVRRERLARLGRESSPRAALAALFAGWIEQLGSGRSGCFLTNSALELAARDPEVEALVARSQVETEVFFRRLVRRGQRLGEIDPGIDPRRTAAMLLAALLGLLVLARSRPERRLLQSVAAGALGALG